MHVNKNYFLFRTYLIIKHWNQFSYSQKKSALTLLFYLLSILPSLPWNRWNDFCPSISINGRGLSLQYLFHEEQDASSFGGFIRELLSGAHEFDGIRHKMLQIHLSQFANWCANVERICKFIMTYDHVTWNNIWFILPMDNFPNKRYFAWSTKYFNISS